MPKLVVAGASLTCSCGTAPSTFAVAVPHQTMAGGPPAGTINDFVPMMNIMPFGMCTTTANPQVAAATSAASGVLTPQPCIPVTTSPWTPGCSKTMIQNQPALHDGCKCQCMWSGSISITNAGQTKVDVT